MRLKEACEIGIEMGCGTLGEALLNVERNAPSLFPYKEMAKELFELMAEAEPFNDDTPVQFLIELLAD